MKPSHILTAAAAVALLGGAAYAQQPAEPTPAPADNSASSAPAPSTDVTAPAATGTAASATTTVRAMQPIPDTKENRKLWPPASNAGRRTTPKGN